MQKDKAIGKKLYYKEDKLGEIVDIRRNPLGSNHEIVVIETSKNDFKAAPATYFEPVEDRYQFTTDKALLESFPAFSSRDIENESKEFKSALTTNFGKPESWDERKKASNERSEQGYMGANAAHNHGARDNKSLQGKVDYDKIKGKK